MNIMRRWQARLLAIEIVGKHEYALQQHPHNAIAVVSITPDLCHHLSSLWSNDEALRDRSYPGSSQHSRRLKSRNRFFCELDYPSFGITMKTTFIKVYCSRQAQRKKAFHTKHKTRKGKEDKGVREK